MADEDEIKEWVKVTHNANGQGSVTVSLVQGNLSVKWSEKLYVGLTKKTLPVARKNARRELRELREALAELDAEEAA